MLSSYKCDGRVNRLSYISADINTLNTASIHINWSPVSLSRLIKETVFFCVASKSEVLNLFLFHSRSSKNEAVLGRSTTFLVFCCPCPSSLETCRCHQIQNEQIFTNVLNSELTRFCFMCVVHSIPTPFGVTVVVDSCIQCSFIPAVVEHQWEAVSTSCKESQDIWKADFELWTLPHVDLLEIMCTNLSLPLSLSSACCSLGPKLQTVHVSPRLVGGRPELHEGSAVSFNTNTRQHENRCHYESHTCHLH